MKRISSMGFLILGFFSLHCNSEHSLEGKTNNMVCLRYSFKIELVINPGRFDLITMQDSTFIFYYKNRLVLKLPSPISNLTKIETDSGTVFSDSGQAITRRFYYVFYNVGDSLANLYGVDSRTNYTTIKTDSIWKSRFNFPSNIVDRNVDSLVGVKHSNGIRTESYIAKSKPDTSYPDSAIINFSYALNNIPFSFSEELDKSRKMKLTKIQFIYKPYFDTAMNGVIPRREFQFEIRKAEEDDFAAKLLRTKD